MPESFEYFVDMRANIFSKFVTEISFFCINNKANRYGALMNFFYFEGKNNEQ